jgi:predicted N-acyltransferase
MADGGPLELTISRIDSLSAVDRAAWDACANPAGGPFDPFVSWDFLQALEAAGCASADEGWRPAHLVAEIDGRLVGATPAYLKTHSYGEYVFDHAWADAFRRAGGRYYPKLQVSVPFTPVPGRRLLSQDERVRDALAAALGEVADRSGLSSVHATFLCEADRRTFADAGWLMRSDTQFHFHNRDYRDFADVLAALSSDKRKNLRKERARAQEGLEIVRLTGRELTEDAWDAFFACYIDTSDRKWGSPYLNRAFFRLIGERMADRIVLVMARAGSRWIAGALNFVGDEALYGRHWGRLEDRPFLHFELCYYQAIDEALARGLARVEAGAQGGHKLARGYEPVTTWSAHHIAHPGFRTAVAQYLEQERRAVARDQQALAQMTPFRIQS